MRFELILLNSLLLLQFESTNGLRELGDLPLA